MVAYHQSLEKASIIFIWQKNTSSLNIPGSASVRVWTANVCFTCIQRLPFHIESYKSESESCQNFCLCWWRKAFLWLLPFQQNLWGVFDHIFWNDVWRKRLQMKRYCMVPCNTMVLCGIVFRLNVLNDLPFKNKWDPWIWMIFHGICIYVYFMVYNMYSCIFHGICSRVRVPGIFRFWGVTGTGKICYRKKYWYRYWINFVLKKVQEPEKMI